MREKIASEISNFLNLLETPLVFEIALYTRCIVCGRTIVSVVVVQSYSLIF